MPEPLPAEHLNLPATRGGEEVEGTVFDGEVVEEAAPGAPPLPPVRAVIILRVVGGHGSVPGA